jgi:hypothetical protein
MRTQSPNGQLQKERYYRYVVYNANDLRSVGNAWRDRLKSLSVIRR